MDEWWISTKHFTCWAKTDKDGKIVDSAPYLRKQIGNNLDKFLNDLRYYRIAKLKLKKREGKNV